MRTNSLCGTIPHEFQHSSTRTDAEGRLPSINTNRNLHPRDQEVRHLYDEDKASLEIVLNSTIIDDIQRGYRLITLSQVLDLPFLPRRWGRPTISRRAVYRWAYRQDNRLETLGYRPLVTTEPAVLRFLHRHDLQVA
ncbi:MAG: hypothetical protein D8M59_14540 [Planctomycetes bacterium]|nr:hypothetical protein [Planctomycetota bacterium]